jgi:hypothetical protein
MTKFYKLLAELDFKHLAQKTTEQLVAMLNTIYDYCDEKYGKVTGPFFTATWQPNKSIKRGLSHGLDVHHKWEYDPNNSEVCSLSDPITAREWFDAGYLQYQLPEYLVYCNWIEHQAIHAIIDTLRNRQYGAYRPGCIEKRRAPILNRYYNEGLRYIQTMELNEKFTSREYFIKALTTCEEEVETYTLIMEAWAEANNIEDWLVLGYSFESLQNCNLIREDD